MRRPQRLEDLTLQPQGLPRNERSLAVEAGAQGAPRHVFHREEHDVLVLTLVVDRDHVRIRELGRGAGLAAEPLDEPRVASQVRAHDLQGDLAIETLVEGDVHAAHPAVREVGAHAVATVDQPADKLVAGRRHSGSLSGSTDRSRQARAGRL